MKERGILFSAPMVRALLEGRKTQTRRVLKAQDVLIDGGGHPFTQRWDESEGVNWRRDVPCPYGQSGDRLWCRETWSLYRPGSFMLGTGDWSDPDWWETKAPTTKPRGWRTVYRADDGWGDEPESEHWRPSIFMPRWASRITLEVTGVRVERLQDISQEDAAAEGVEPAGGFMTISGAWQRYTADGPSCEGPRESFRSLWSSINGPESWAANPFVWVLEFKRLEAKERAA